MIRAFIAARIAENPPLRELHRQLSQLGNPFRPVPLADLHVTLKFLGSIDERKLAGIVAVMRDIAAQYPAEVVRLAGLGAFPHAKRPSVVWVGMENAQSLCAIAAGLEGALTGLGFPAEQRPFQPHLTLLRVKTRPPETLFALLEECAGADYGTATINSIDLLRSDLLDNGPRYTVLATAPLAATAQSPPQPGK